jgi:hypothetical protein
MIKPVMVPVILSLVLVTNNRYLHIVAILEVQQGEPSFFTDKNTIYEPLEFQRLMMNSVNPNVVGHTRRNAHRLRTPHI